MGEWGKDCVDAHIYCTQNIINPVQTAPQFLFSSLPPPPGNVYTHVSAQLNA